MIGKKTAAAGTTQQPEKAADTAHRPSTRRLVIGALGGWFFPYWALMVAAGLGLWFLFADKLARRLLAVLIVVLTIPAILHLALALPLVSELE